MTAALALSCVALALVALWYGAEARDAKVQLGRMDILHDAEQQRALAATDALADVRRRCDALVADLRRQLAAAQEQRDAIDTPEARRARLRLLGAAGVQTVPDHDDDGADPSRGPV